MPDTLPTDRRRRLLIAAALCGIVAFHLVGNLHWLWRNTIQIGHDASKYLQTSLEYTQFFGLSPQGLYQAFTYDAYRPPALFLAIQPFYALFGQDPDSAQLVNLVLFGGVILLVFWIGAHIASPGVGLFSALLLSFLPMMTAMSRLLYTEMLLTALVALNLLALYQTRGFSRRGWSLLWGASLGLGLLVKWTMPIYVALPLAWFLWRAGLLRLCWQSLRSFRPDFRHAALAVVIAALIAAAWVLPNRGAIENSLAWYWLFLGWWLIGALLLIGLFRPSTPASNLWSASLLALALASLWYLPYLDFGARLLAVDEERGAVGASPLNWLNYWRYARYLYWEHFGPLVFWVIVPVALAPWLWSWRKRRSLQPLAHPLWLSIGGALIALFVISQANARNLTPLLPSAALLAVIGLQSYPRSWRTGIGALWLVVLIAQWTLFTFDGFFSLFQSTEPLWVRSSYVVQPASGSTDAGYGISDDVLDHITANSQERQFLAMLVNIPTFHRGSLRAQISFEGRNVRIKDVTEERANPWYNILTSEWVLVKDGDNRDVEGSALQVIQEILGGDALFHALYREEQRYVLPNGETVYLYGRAVAPFGYPQMMPDLLAATEAAAKVIRNGWSQHASLLLANRDLAFWTALHGIPTGRVRVMDKGVSAESAFSGYIGSGDALFVVTAPFSDGWLQWLDAHAYHAYAAAGDFAGLDLYGWPQEPLQARDVHAAWPGLALTTLRTLPRVAPGQVLPLEATWLDSTGADDKVSYRLLAPDGAVVAAFDRPIATDDRLGLFVPPQTQPGTYQVAAVVYDAASLAPAVDVDGNTPTHLFDVAIEPNP